MSTTIIGTSLHTVASYNSSLFSVGSSEKESLADYVRLIRREKRISTTDVENRSGGEISDAYVTRIENQHVKNVSIDKLSSLAKGLQVPPV